MSRTYFVDMPRIILCWGVHSKENYVDCKGESKAYKVLVVNLEGIILGRSGSRWEAKLKWILRKEGVRI